MDSFTDQWNNISSHARQVIILCGLLQGIIMVILMRVLEAYDKNRRK